MPKAGAMAGAAKTKATIESVEAHLASGNVPAAAIAVRQLHTRQPSPKSLALYRRILSVQIHTAIQHRNQDDFDRALRAAETLLPKDPGAMTERAGWLAKWGLLPQAMMALPETATEADRHTLVCHAADRAVTFKSYAGLPEEHHEGCKAVVLAFTKYEKGNDDGTKELLQGFGLQSPFLEWKMLLRGLMAFTAGDDAKAIENWQRLDDGRLAVRLARPLRARIDPEFRKGFAPHVLSIWNEQARTMLGSPAQQHVMALQKIIGQPVALSKSWSTVDKAWACLKPTRPDLAERLKECVYHAIVRQGHPNDLPRYRQIFGAPADDPNFDRLQAMVLESQDQFLPAMSFWEKYERWLASKPAGWNEAFLNRARAHVLTHLGELCEDASADQDGDDLQNAFNSLMGMGPAEKPKHPPEHYYHKAIAADGSSIDARRALVRMLATSGQADAMLRAAEELLAIAPDNSETLHDVSGLLVRTKRAMEALPYRERALAANPLDENAAIGVAVAATVAARQTLEDGDAAGALELLDKFKDLCDRHSSLDSRALRVTVLLKLGHNADALKLLDEVLAAPFARLAALHTLSVDAVLAKLKPAARTAAGKRFTEALALPATMEEILLLQAASDAYATTGFEYRGQKSFGKKIEALLDRAVGPGLTEAQVNSFAGTLEIARNDKLTIRIGNAMLALYPKNVRLLITLAKALSHRRSSWKEERRIERLLKQAKADLTAGSDPQKDKLLAAVDALLRHYAGPFGAAFDNLFGGNDDFN